MKTVILMRHSKPQKAPGVPNERIPLSSDGVSMAKALFSHPVFDSCGRVCSSPYRRACETAGILSGRIQTDLRLRERELGDPASLNREFWGLQYRNHSYKNQGGESLLDAKLRMTGFMEELIHSMSDGETAVVVSHAAAICAYLLNFCSITVTNEEKKWRHIQFEGRTVLNGPIATPGAFVLTFHSDELTDLSYIRN